MEAFGLNIVLKEVDIGCENVTLLCDASPAIGVANRSGIGKLRHLHVAYLWLQQKVKDGCLGIANVSGNVNLGDVFTKHVPAISMVDRIDNDTFLKFAQPFKKESCKLVKFQKNCDKRFSSLLHHMDQSWLL